MKGVYQSQGRWRVTVFHPTQMALAASYADGSRMNPLKLLLKTDRALVERALAGQPEAFEALVQRYQRLVYAIARGLGLPRDAAEDAVQECFLRGFRDLADLREPGAFGSWLLRIARNVARDHLPRRLRTNAAPLPDAEAEKIEARTPGPEEMDFQNYLWRQVQELPEATREAVFLYYHDGESTRAVARALGISLSAVKSRLEHGRSLLREKLWREMERCFRGTLPSRREWRQRGRRLTLGVLVAVPAASAAYGSIAAAFSSGRAAGEGLSATVTTGALVMSAKKLGILLASVILIALGGGLWLTDPLGWRSGARSAVEVVRDDPSTQAPGAVDADADGVPAEDEGTAPVVDVRQETAIAGTVFFIDQQDPAAGASIAVVLDGERSQAGETIAGEDGTWRIAGLVPGSYRVTAWKESWTAGDSSWDTIAIRAGEVIDGVKLTLVPGASLDVDVLAEETREPVAGATVRSGYRIATTDEAGRCRLEGVPAGGLLVTATAGGFAVGASWLDVSAGEEPLVRMLLLPGGMIEGRVTMHDGRPAAGATVQVRVNATAGYHFSLEARADQDGRYHRAGIPLWRKDVEVSASLDGLFGTRASVSGFAAGAERIELDLKLAAGFVVAGRVVDEEGSPVGAAEVSVGRWRGGLTKTDAAGRFRIEGATEETNGLVARKKGFAACERTISGLSPAEREGLDLVLEPGHVVAGTVEDAGGKPIAAARVTAWLWPYPTALTDRSGRFRFEDLSAQVREVWASKPGYLESRGNRAAADRTDVRLVLEEEGNVKGIVVDGSTGQPLDAFTVKVRQGKKPGERGNTAGSLDSSLVQTGHDFSGADGRFTVHGLVPGAFYRLTVIGREHVEAVPDEVEAWPAFEARAPIRIDATREKGLRGTVVHDLSGEPLRGVRVRHLGGPHYDPAANRYHYFVESFQPENPTWRTTVTRIDGSFSLSGLCEKPGTLLLEKPGFARTAISPFVAGDEEQVFRLPVEAVVSGAVTTAAGAPVPGVDLRVRMGKQYLPEARTDAEGRYRIDGLPAGEVSVILRPFGLRRIEEAMLRAGEETVVDFVEPPGAIAGRVSAAGEPVPMALVFVGRPPSDQAKTTVKADVHGLYRIDGLPPGTYEVIAQRGNGAATRERIVEVNASEVRCDLELGRGSLSGQVLDHATGAPVPGCRVEIIARKQESEAWYPGRAVELRRGEHRFTASSSTSCRRALTALSPRVHLTLPLPAGLGRWRWRTASP